MKILSQRFSTDVTLQRQLLYVVFILQSERRSNALTLRLKRQRNEEPTP